MSYSAHNPLTLGSFKSTLPAIKSLMSTPSVSNPLPYPGTCVERSVLAQIVWDKTQLEACFQSRNLMRRERAHS